MKGKISTLLIVGILIAILFYLFYSKMSLKPEIATPPIATTDTLKPGEVSIKRNVFEPDPINIRVGDIVTWTNNESYAHDVVSDNGEFKSPKMATGEKFSHTFTKEGTYNYICGIHPFMRGSIIVTK